MSARVVDRVGDWDERPFSGGYPTVSEFATEEFSGVIRAGGAELYMTKGAIVGILHGDIEDFEDIAGTAYEAPSPALPLLAIMQETNDEVRAEYYSEKTALSEVDSTLTEGGFTGYIELADNVLSGDYYQVYHGGQSMSVGFIGASERLIDGDEAFQTANDEVGIYQVRPADIEILDIPDTETASTGTTSASAATNETDTASTATTETTSATAEADDEATELDNTEPADEEAVETTETADEQAAETDSTEPAEPTEPASRSGTNGEGGSTPSRADDQTETAESGRADTVASPEETGDSNTAETESTGATTHAPAEATERESASETEPAVGGGRPGQQASTETESGKTQSESAASAQRTNQPATTHPPDRQSTDEQRRTDKSESRSAGDTDLHLETRAVPSLDPGRTVEPNTGTGRTERQTGRSTAGRQSPSSRNTQQRATQDSGQPSQQAERTTAHSSQQAEQSPAQAKQTQPEQPDQTQTERRPAESSSAETADGAESQQATQQSATTPEDTVPSAELDELKTELEDRETEIKHLESELDRKTTEYEDAKEQLEAVREERDQLAEQVEQLESELDHLETQFGVARDTERRMTPAEALAQTDIFPRYESKGDATLKKAHGGSHRPKDIASNLRLEQNTQFDSSNVSVNGQEYNQFLESTLEYRFVQWIVRDLLFEIRETGHQKALKDLYDALPTIDWADLKGTVDVVYTEEGQETRSQESFDLILRNRMGEPLIVANINDSREGATETMMERLVRSAERVGQSSDAFAGAFLVTRSFFEPPALETADEATQGGLLSRDKRKSFVNLSRKQGYHLCLVEARNENFTLLVPEL